jgi:hypothetical protein
MPPVHIYSPMLARDARRSGLKLRALPEASCLEGYSMPWEAVLALVQFAAVERFDRTWMIPTALSLSAIMDGIFLDAKKPPSAS